MKNYHKFTKPSGIHLIWCGGIRCENKKSFRKLFMVPYVSNQVCFSLWLTYNRFELWERTPYQSSSTTLSSLLQSLSTMPTTGAQFHVERHSRKKWTNREKEKKKKQDTSFHFIKCDILQRVPSAFFLPIFFSYFFFFFWKHVHLYVAADGRSWSETGMSTRYGIQHGLQVHSLIFLGVLNVYALLNVIKCFASCCVRFVYQRVFALCFHSLVCFSLSRSLFLFVGRLRVFLCATIFVSLLDIRLAVVYVSCTSTFFHFFSRLLAPSPAKVNLIRWIQFWNLIVSSVILNQLCVRWYLITWLHQNVPHQHYSRHSKQLPK